MGRGSCSARLQATTSSSEETPSRRRLCCSLRCLRVIDPGATAGRPAWRGQTDRLLWPFAWRAHPALNGITATSWPCQGLDFFACCMGVVWQARARTGSGGRWCLGCWPSSRQLAGGGGALGVRPGMQASPPSPHVHAVCMQGWTASVCQPASIIDATAITRRASLRIITWRYAILPLHARMHSSLPCCPSRVILVGIQQKRHAPFIILSCLGCSSARVALLLCCVVADGGTGSWALCALAAAG